MPPISTRWQVDFKAKPLDLCPNGKGYFTCLRIATPNSNYLETCFMECMSQYRHLSITINSLSMEHVDYSTQYFGFQHIYVYICIKYILTLP